MQDCYTTEIILDCREESDRVIFVGEVPDDIEVVMFKNIFHYSQVQNVNFGKRLISLLFETSSMELCSNFNTQKVEINGKQCQVCFCLFIMKNQ